jgi:hypothetical protein
MEASGPRALVSTIELFCVPIVLHVVATLVGIRQIVIKLK